MTCCSGNATMHSACIVEVLITGSNINVLSVAQRKVRREFMWLATIQSTWVLMKMTRYCCAVSTIFAASQQFCSTDFPFWISWPLKMGPIGWPEMSVRNCHYTLRNSPTSHLYRGGYLKSRKGRPYGEGAYQISWRLKMEPKCFPETSAENCRYTLRNKPEDCRSQIFVAGLQPSTGTRAVTCRPKGTQTDRQTHTAKIERFLRLCEHS